MLQRRNALAVAGIAFAALAIVASVLPAFAQPAAGAPAITPGQVQSITSCIAGKAGNPILNSLTSLFTPATNNIASSLVSVIKYYEVVAFALVISLVILRLVIANARESIDGFLTSAFSSALGPSILFAAGMFLATTIGNGSSSAIGTILAKTEAYGGTVASQAFGTPATDAAAQSLSISDGLDNGRVGGLMQAGICASEAVIFGVPPADTGNAIVNKVLSFATTMVQSLEALGNGVPGIVLLALTFILKGFIAIFLLWTIAKLAYEVFTIFLIKMFVIPLGLLFFAFGQIEFLGFLKDAYIRFIVTTLARVLVLALLLPLFFGIMLGAMVIGTNISLASGLGGVGGQAVGTFVQLFIDLVGVAFLNFFVDHYRDFYEPLVNGSSGATGANLTRSVGEGVAPIANAVKSLAAAVSGVVPGAVPGVGSAAVGSIGPAASAAGSAGESPSAQFAGSAPVAPPKAAPSSGTGAGSSSPLPPPPAPVHVG